jgi:hypothetical protein
MHPFWGGNKMSNEDKLLSEEIIFIENKNLRFEQGRAEFRNEFDVIDGVKILNPIKGKRAIRL